MAAKPTLSKSSEKSVRWYLSCRHWVRGYTRGAQPTSLLVKHLMDKGDGNRSFADG
jgi:hypothetical protein